MKIPVNSFVFPASESDECPVSGMPLLTIPEFVNVHMGGDYCISFYKIGEQIVYLSSSGNLLYYDVEPFNEVMRRFCQAANVKMPYLQISDVSNLTGRIPLSELRKQAQQIRKQQNSLAGIITINDPSWMKLFISLGGRFYSSSMRFVSVKNYAEAIHAAIDILKGKLFSNPETGLKLLHKTIQFDNIIFNPQWEYNNPSTRFIFKLGVIPGLMQYSSMHGNLTQPEDVKEAVSLVQILFELNPLKKGSFIVVDLSNVSGHTPFHLKQLFAKELKRVRSQYDLSGVIHVIVSSSNFLRAAAKLFFALMKQPVITATNIDDAFKKINEPGFSPNGNKNSDTSINISRVDLDEIIEVCSYMVWEKEGESVSIEVSPNNPLFEIAGMLDIFKADLNEQRIRELKKNQQRLEESEKTRVQLLSMMEDAEAAKEDLMKTKAEMVAIIENTLDSIWSVNTSYEIVYINENFTKSYFDTFGVVLKPGSNVIENTPESLRLEWKERYDRVFKGERWVIVDQIAVNGPAIFIEVAANPIYNNGIVVGASLFGRNITERIRAEETQQQLELYKKTIKIKQNFLANMSHEIRTPLTGVLGMLEILEQTRLDEHQKDYLQTLKTSGKHLKQIIDQVLDYSKIEAGQIKINPGVFALKSMIKQSLLLYKNTLDPGVEIKHFIDPQIPLFLEADEFRLSQVLNNLVSNAVKFTHEGSVSVNSMLIAQNNTENTCSIRVEITDTGPGIPDCLQEKLFTPFSQIEVSDIRKYEGTGLGLSICRELIKLFGGELGVTSQVGKGSTFWFTFTANVAQTPRIDDQKKGSGKVEKELTILLAEDKIVNQKVIKLMLSSLGHVVHIANNGQEALDQFQPGKFDLILMDIQMPVLDGVKTTQKLKEKYKNRPPIVGLSANAFEGDRGKYMDLGMDEYLTKPVKRDDFETLIRKLIL